jgi:hypothetical protein
MCSAVRRIKSGPRALPTLALWTRRTQCKSPDRYTSGSTNMCIQLDTKPEAVTTSLPPRRTAYQDLRIPIRGLSHMGISLRRCARLQINSQRASRTHRKRTPMRSSLRLCAIRLPPNPRRSSAPPTAVERRKDHKVPDYPPVSGQLHRGSA